MRALFAYYDTNRDGNLSSVQALRIFQLTPDPAAEWAAVNHFRNDKVSPQQLAYFLANCDKLIPESHLQRFLMLYT
ncbi:hypothetical protein DYB28_005521 [Aphanomyces astaci]|nr:hypothetical protein DYB36_005453 [Aphanomyces astaci]RHY41254.1 hypothetical protein DYB30_001396 [Aphanomyces astaci]RHY42561.1 hypothetical protein DYB34_005837 [Aphanomyces astaci]RHY82128.1 hypothetical protein DYB26_006108 [Aphanomyces astaci]RHZ04639.1 hypothetical protein DYB31_005344 [Aphanomyces astaci]